MKFGHSENQDNRAWHIGANDAGDNCKCRYRSVDAAVNPIPEVADRQIPSEAFSDVIRVMTVFQPVLNSRFLCHHGAIVILAVLCRSRRRREKCTRVALPAPIGLEGCLSATGALRRCATLSCHRRRYGRVVKPRGAAHGVVRLRVSDPDREIVVSFVSVDREGEILPASLSFLQQSSRFFGGCEGLGKFSRSRDVERLLMRLVERNPVHRPLPCSPLAAIACRSWRGVDRPSARAAGGARCRRQARDRGGTSLNSHRLGIKTMCQLASPSIAAGPPPAPVGSWVLGGCLMMTRS